MFTKVYRKISRARRAIRARSKIAGTAANPRLVVFRSLRHITAMLINDENSETILSLTDRAMTGKPVARAKQVGEQLALLAKEKKIKQVVFDRSGYKYHGRVAALAEGARAGGLKL